jgi:hypothetical protein
MKAIADAAAFDDDRTERIFKEHMRLPPEQWEARRNGAVFLSAKEAAECGLAHSISEFSPPRGERVFHADRSGAHIMGEEKIRQSWRLTGRIAA